MSVAERQLTNVERVPWEMFLQNYFRWNQGEHVSCIGPTGCGKTTLAERLLPRRRFVAAFATKRKDETMDYLIHERAYRLIDEWPPPPRLERVVLWPQLPFSLRNIFGKPDTSELLRLQQKVFAETLDDMYWSGAWCAYIDEAWYLDVFLGLRKPLNLLLGAGRAGGNSMVMGTQRPVNVTRSMFSEATHLFLWRLTDIADRKRLLEISGGVDKRFIMRQVAGLQDHEVFYVNTRLGTMVTTRVDLTEGG